MSIHALDASASRSVHASANSLVLPEAGTSCERSLTASKLALGGAAFFASALAYKCILPAVGIATLAGSALAIHQYFCNWISSKFVNVPKMDIRERPSLTSPIASQALLGDKVEVEKTTWGLLQPSWSSIKTADGYRGWVLGSGLVGMQCLEPKSGRQFVQVTARSGGYLYSEKDTEFGPKLIAPYGSTLRLVDDADARWARVVIPDGTEFFIQKGDIAEEPPITNREELVNFARTFLGKHFAWGGKGDEFDSSGFVQMLYKAIGIDLPRDSKDQIQDPRFEKIREEDVRPGDLVFYGADRERIRGVGMCIGNGKFINATIVENKPWIKISDLSDDAWNGADPLRPYRTFRSLKAEF